MKNFYVIAHHATGAKPWDGEHTFRCYPAFETVDTRWYAVSKHFGCSKNYKTPEDAINGMLQEHACQAYVIHETE